MNYNRHIFKQVEDVLPTYIDMARVEDNVTLYRIEEPFIFYDSSSRVPQPTESIKVISIDNLMVSHQYSMQSETHFAGIVNTSQSVDRDIILVKNVLSKFIQKIIGEDNTVEYVKGSFIVDGAKVAALDQASDAPAATFQVFAVGEQHHFRGINTCDWTDKQMHLSRWNPILTIDEMMEVLEDCFRDELGD